MKQFLVAFLLVGFINGVAQNKPVLYNFDKIPQTLLLNPGAETTYKYHIAVPFLSGNSVSAGITTITLADVFKDNGVSIFRGDDITVRVQDAVRKLSGKDYVSANSQIEVVSGGYKLNKTDYFSAGFYTELDVFTTIPKDILTLSLEGNAAYLEKSFSVSQARVKGEVTGVLHAGISRRFNNRFTGGIRLKIYSGSANILSTDNQGSLTTTKGAKGIYRHELSGLDVEVKSSGVYNDDDNEVSLSAGSAFGGAFLGGNYGAGIDLGFTSYWNEQLQFTASILDVGFIHYYKNTKNARANGSYVFEGIDFSYSGQNNAYWSDLKKDFEEKIPNEEDDNSYTTIRPIKLNGSVRYSFGKSRKIATCHDISFKDFYDNAVGGQIYTVFRPTGPKFALTAFYERKFTTYLNTKITYTIDDFSATNFGVGLSYNFWKLNMYVAAGNILNLTDVATAHTASLQFGINFILN